MAELDPAIQPNNESNYLGYSRGSIPDSSIGGLFTDIAQMTTDATKLTTGVMLESAREDFTNSADEIRDVFTGRADARPTPLDRSQPYRAGEGLGLTGPRTPEEVRQYEERLATLRQAYQSGTLRESHYWAMLDMESRRIRQRFPGFREEIDKMVASVVGGNPANRLVQELNQEAMRGQRSRAEQEYWLRQASQRGLAGDSQARAAQGRPISDEEYQQRVNAYEARKAADEMQQRDLALAHARGVNIREDASRQAINSMRAQQAQTLAIATSGMGLQFNQIQERVAEITRSGRLPSPDELTALRTQFSGLRQQLMSQHDAALYQTRQGGTSWASLIGDPAEIEKVRGTLLGELNAIEKYLGEGPQNGGWSALGVILGNLKAIQEGDHYAALRHQPLLRNQEVAVKIFGNQLVMNNTFQNNAQFTDALNTLLQTDLSRMAATGTSLDTVTREARQQPGYRPQLTHEQITRGMAIITNPQTPMQGLRNFATSFFGEGNSRFLDQVTNKADTYTMMVTDPRIATNMQRLRESDPDLYQMYQKWVVDNFVTAMQETGNTMQNMVLSPSSGQILTFNPNTTRFILQNGDTNQNETVSRLNNTIAGVANMLKAEGRTPEQINQVVKGLVDSLRINTNASSRGNLPQNMWDSVRMADWRLGVRQGTANANNPPEASTRQITPLSNLIGEGEAGQFGYNQGFAGRPNERGQMVGQWYDLSNMTLAQVRDLQRNIISQQRSAGVPEGTASSAIGRYQMTQANFDQAVRALGLDPATTKFTPQVQDQMFLYHANKLGLQEYLKGSLSEDQFMDRLAGFWAALPKADGTPGITQGQNRPNRTVGQVREVLRQLKREFSVSGG